MPANIYVASSWKNLLQPAVVKALSEHDFAVYDFRRPSSGNHGFHWSQVDPAWSSWSAEQYLHGLEHDRAREGFATDFAAMEWACWTRKIRIQCCAQV